MSKKIILLALAAVSAVIFALPAAASALTPLHVVPKPEGTKTAHGGAGVLRGSFGTVSCKSSTGAVTYTTTTTGTLTQTFKECSGFGAPCTTKGQASGVIVTTTLEFHLATVKDITTGATGPGVLVTPGKDASGNPHFATFECLGITFVVRGTGLIGTITNVACGASSSEPNLVFSPSAAGSNVQTHKRVVGTETDYNLTTNGGESSEEASGVVTLGTAAKLECT
jgi:hypothetical protein